MPWVRHWEEEKYDLAGWHTLTICCEGMKRMVGHLAAYCIAGTGQYGIRLMDMSSTPWTPILPLKYCPHCGKKVQVETQT